MPVVLKDRIGEFFNIVYDADHFMNARRIYGVSRDELKRFVDAYRFGMHEVFIQNTTHSLIQVRSVCICDVSKIKGYKDSQLIVENLVALEAKLESIYFSNLSNLIRNYGKDITSELITGVWGYNKQLSSDKVIAEPNFMQAKSDIETPTNNLARIFISHSSLNKAIVDKFIDHILRLGLNVSPDRIFCTSVQGMDIRSGEDFKQRIKSELESAGAVFQFLSSEYKASEVCLNEMGAAWVLGTKVIPLLLPGMSYDVGFIHQSSQQLKLNNRESLIKLFDDHKEDLWDSKISFADYSKQVDAFLSFVNQFAHPQPEKNNQETVFFYNEEAELKGKLDTALFQHPPGLESESEGSWHRYYTILLDKPIKVLTNKPGGAGEGNYDSNYFNITQIHVFPAQNVAEPKNLKTLVGKRVRIKGFFMGGHTAWHRTNVLLQYNMLESTSS